MKKALITILVLSALALLASCTGDTQETSSTVSTEQTSMTVSTEESSADESSVEESSAVESSEAESSVEDSSEDEESSELAELNYVGVNGYTDFSYQAEDSKVLSAVYGEQYAVCFPDWEQYAVIDGELICAAVTGNTALGFGYEKGETHPDGYSLYNIRLYRFAKGSDEVEESTIELPKGCIYHTMFYSALTRDSGYLAVFETEYESSQRHILSYLLFTADGGKTWQTVDTVPLTSDPNDYPLMLRFVNENTGVLSFGYQNVPSVAERTYITTDGGKTWNSLQGLTGIEHEEGSEAVDFVCQDGVYILTLRIPPENTQLYRYISDDLQSWTFLPKEIVTDYKPDNLDELTFKTCYTYFDGEYVGRTELISFAEDGADLVLHLAEDGEYASEHYYLLRNTSIDNFYRYCASAIGPYMWFFNYAEEDHVIEVFRSHETGGYTTIAVPENTDIQQLFCKMVDGRVGYLFVFAADSGNTHTLAYLYKTADGGATWQTVESDSMPEYHHRDTPIYANFFDENTGLISCRYASLGYLSERTFLTTDGGKTWSYLSALPYPEDMDSSVCTELEDLECIYGQYVMTVGLLTDGASTSLRFVSDDLQNWTLLPEELGDCEFKRYDAELGIFEGVSDGNHVIYVTEWDALYTVAGTGYDYLQYYRAHDSLFVFSAHGADNPDAFALYRLDKGKTDAQTVDLGLPEDFANIGCKLQVFDKDTALFVLNEYHEHRAKMYAVFKTTDGGETWVNIGKQLDETLWPLYEGISELHFFDENNGILYREFTDTEYLGDRVLVTTDGGATWTNPVITPDGKELDVLKGRATITDMKYENGTYTFSIEQYLGENEYAYATFTSDDLQSWKSVG